VEGETYVILGTGPVGCWTARALHERGLTVRAVNRSGRRPALLPPQVELTTADLMEADQARAATEGATAIVQAAAPPYARWSELFPPLHAGVLAAAEAAGARLVAISNLYMLDPTGTIDEEAAVNPRSRKGRLRQRLWEELKEAHERGAVQAAELRASDYYGPGVHESVFGEGFFAPLLAGRPARVIGDPDAPHALAYVEDVGRAAAGLATRSEGYGRWWLAPHASAPTPREVLEGAAEIEDTEPRMRAMGPLAMRLGGLFVPQARAMIELMDMFRGPFEVDARRSQEALGIEPTPLPVGVRRTLAWFRAQRG
jgi:nucleoside-diphosphate-sugar epimerase